MVKRGIGETFHWLECVRVDGHAVWRYVPLALALGLVGFLWKDQATLVGPMFDYSLVIHGTFQWEHGQLPHRDFASSLQVGTLALGRLFEMFFGATYLSLGLANLFVALVLMVGTFYMALPHLGSLVATLVAVAFTLSTALQHGIIWYNTIAASLFILLVLNFANKPTLSSLIVGGLLCVFSGITKLNYHLCAIVCAALIAIYAAKPSARKLGWIGLSVVFGVCAGPFVEMAMTGIGPTQWVREMLLASARIRNTVQFFTNFRDVYTLFASIPFNVFVVPWARAMPLVFAVFFLLYLLRATHRRVAMFCFLGAVYGATLAIILTNQEIIIHKAALFLVGPVALAVAHRHDRFCRRLVGLSALYLIGVSLPAVLNHSRLAFEPINGPFIDGGAVHPYFSGARIDAKRAVEMKTIFKALENPIREKRPIYFGPGTGYFFRLANTIPTAGLPLWWDLDSSYHSDGLGELVRKFYSHGFVAITFNEWGFLLPQAIHERMGAYRLVSHEAKHLNILVLE